MRWILKRGIARGVALLGLCLSLGLAGCDTVSDLFEGSDEALLEGERLSVIALERQLEPDPDAALLTVRLPPPYVNEDWPQPGGYPHHAMHHLAADEVLAEAWRVRIGSGTDEDGPVLATPVVSGGRVYTMDSRSLISAFNATTGARLWTADARPEEDDEGAFGGGLAVAGDRLFATTGLGHVLALDAQTGALHWRQPIGVPVRVSPVISGGRVFAVSHDNRLWALDTENGAVLWSHTAIEESAGFLGRGEPGGGWRHRLRALLVRRTDGAPGRERPHGLERYPHAFRAPASAPSRPSTISTDIPCPTAGRSSPSAMAGAWLPSMRRSGRRVWERDIAGLDMPWVAGDFLFVMTADGELVCMSRERGTILWVRSLPRFEDPEDREDPILLDRPDTGRRSADRRGLGRQRALDLALRWPLPGRVQREEAPIRLAPVVADRTLFILTDNADLIALR